MTFVRRDGQRLAVLRPVETPSPDSILVTRDALKRNDIRASGIGDRLYRLEGFVGIDQRVLDDDERALGEFVDGDLFVLESELSAFRRAADA